MMSRHIAEHQVFYDAPSSINHVPREKRIDTRKSGRRYRQAMRECAKLARQHPQGERIRVYRDCLKRRVRAIEQVG